MLGVEWKRASEVTGILFYLSAAATSITATHYCLAGLGECPKYVIAVGVLVATASLLVGSGKPYSLVYAALAALSTVLPLLPYPFKDPLQSLVLASTTAVLGTVLGLAAKSPSLGVAAASGLLWLNTEWSLFPLVVLASIGAVVVVELYATRFFHWHQLVFLVGAVAAGLLGAQGFTAFAATSYAAASLIVTSLSRTGFSKCPFRREEFLVRTGSYVAVAASIACLYDALHSTGVCAPLFSVGVLTAITGFMAPRSAPRSGSAPRTR